MFQLQPFFWLHCDEWDRVVALPRHKFVTGATLLQLSHPTKKKQHVNLIRLYIILTHTFHL
jgi:hypothetical protein